MIESMIFNFIQPLDLGNILFNTVAGSVQIGLLLLYISIIILALFFRMPDIIAMSVFILLLTLLTATEIASDTTQFLFGVIVIGVLLFGLIISRIVK